MKLSKLCLALSAALILTSCTVKTTENNKRTVTVTGTSSITVEPDNCTLVFSVSTKGKEASQTVQNNSAKMTKIQDAIIELGISKDNISTENYSITPEFRADRQTVSGYTVTNRFSVFTKDLPLTGEIVDVSLKNGALISECNFGISDIDIYVKQARTLAVQNAQDAANLIAGTSGAMLGKVISIREIYESDSFLSHKKNKDSENSTASGITVANPGKTKIEKTVAAVYELK